MCLEVTRGTWHTRQRFKGKKYLEFYKKVYYCGSQYFGGELISPFYAHIWKPGWNKARGEIKKIRTVSIYIHEGVIHVYNRKPKIGLAYSRTRILKVRGYEKDFVASGYGESCFKKVYVTKKDYEECRK